jgi:RNA polymerase sigma factor (sigma-70 family)
MVSTVCRSVVLRDCGTEGEERREEQEPAEARRRARFETAWRCNVTELDRRSLNWSGGRREDADDALGQAALVALEKLPSELQPEELRRWLLRLVYSKCMDIHRHRKRARCVSRNADDSAPEEEIPAAGPGLESTLLAGELIAVARDRIQRLPPRLRHVAELYLLRDLSYAEIADRLALTEVNIRKRMQEARAQLREPLQAYVKGDVRVQAPRRRDPAGSSPATAQSEPDSEPEPEPLRPSGWTLPALERYVRNHPRSWKKRWELALRLRDAGDLEQAVLHFREATGRQPRRMELWLDLGTTLTVLGRGEAAREAFETALSRAQDEVSRVRLRELIEQF